MKRISRKSLGLAMLLLIAASITLLSFKDKLSGRHLELNTMSGEQIYRGLFFSQGTFANKISCMKGAAAQWDNMPEADKKQHMDFYNEIVTSIKKNDPGFFDKFQAKIETRNYSDINDALKEGGQELIKAAMQSPKYSLYFSVVNDMIKSGEIAKYNLSSQEGNSAYLKSIQEKMNEREGKATAKKGDDAFKNNSSTKLAIPIFVVYLAVWDAAAAVNYVAAVNAAALATVYAAVVVKTVFWTENSSTPQNNLQKEKLISEISDL